MPNLSFRSQTNGNDSSFSVSSVSATLPAGTATGDLMVIWVSAGAISPTAAPTVATPSGWTSGGSGTASIVGGVVNIRIHCFYKVATASEGSATLNAGVNSAFGWGRLSYQNPDLVTPFGQVTFGSGSASTSAVLTGITTGAANAMLLTFLTQGVAQGTTPPGSMTERIDNATAGFEVADEIKASPGATGTRTFTLPTSSDHAWGFSEFRSSGVAGAAASTNANDTSAASGATTVTGAAARTNANDTLAASGSAGVAVSGTLARTNANDAISAAGTTTVVGSLSRTNASDTSSSSGTTSVVGSLARTNGNDALSASGAAGAVTGTVSATNSNDSISASGFTPSASVIGAPGARPWVAYVNGQRVAGSYWDLRRLIEEFAEDQAEKEVIRDKSPKRARIVIDAGKKLPQAERTIEAEALSVQKDMRQVYGLAYAKAKLKLEHDKDEEEAILLLM